MANLKENNFEQTFENQPYNTFNGYNRHKRYNRPKDKPLVVITPPKKYEKSTFINRASQFIGQFRSLSVKSYLVEPLFKMSQRLKETSTNWLLNQKEKALFTLKKVDFETRVMSFVYMAAILLLLVATFKQQTNF